MELNTLDLGRPVGATQQGAPVLASWVSGSVPALTVLGGFGKDYGLWVKITVACSNRRGDCQEEGAEAWAVYLRLSHTQIWKYTLTVKHRELTQRH